MCGISGIIFKDMDPDLRILMGMGTHQTMRGPDHSGSWLEGNIGLYHNRLSILDLSKNGNQPMHTDRWALVYNGEIYNYRELQRKIPVRQWNSYNDAETLLFLIDELGVEKALDLVEGMFAFAAYDKIERVLWMAVDPMGIKPLYFYHDDKLFAFASSPGALTHCCDKWDLDLDALDDYLALGATYQSLFSGIKKVMPGTVIRREADGRTGTKKYYHGKVHENITEGDLLQAVRDSVQSVKVSDVPVSLFLSGGIDSTVVASGCEFMNAIHLASTEQAEAQLVAERYQINMRIIHPADYTAAACLEDYARKSGDCSMAAVVPYIVSSEVSKLGKVAISANGADELFFGYDRMSEEVTEKQFNHIFREPIAGGTIWDNLDIKDSRQLELETYVKFDLNKTLDFASMCHGVEVRVPYLNKTVIEMARSLPMSKHVRGNRRKVILKDFLDKEGFSSSFIDRPKIGFSLHFSPIGYEDLKVKAVEYLKNEFNISPKLYTGRDKKYFEASAAAFYCWHQAWKDKLN